MILHLQRDEKENEIDEIFYKASVNTNICRNTNNRHSTMFGLLTDTSFLFLICTHKQPDYIK